MTKLELVQSLIDALTWYNDWEEFPLSFNIDKTLTELESLKLNWLRNNLDKELPNAT